MCVMLSGCGLLAPFVPQTSNALSQQSQLEKLQEQNQLLERQTAALERIADSLTVRSGSDETKLSSPRS